MAPAAVQLGRRLRRSGRSPARTSRRRRTGPPRRRSGRGPGGASSARRPARRRPRGAPRPGAAARPRPAPRRARRSGRASPPSTGSPGRRRRAGCRRGRPRASRPRRRSRRAGWSRRRSPRPGPPCRARPGRRARCGRRSPRTPTASASAARSADGGVEVGRDGSVGRPGQLRAARAAGQVVEGGDDAGRAEGEDDRRHDPGDHDRVRPESRHLRYPPRAAGTGSCFFFGNRRYRSSPSILRGMKPKARWTPSSGPDVVEGELAELVGRHGEEAEVERLHGAGHQADEGDRHRDDDAPPADGPGDLLGDLAVGPGARAAELVGLRRSSRGAPGRGARRARRRRRGSAGTGSSRCPAPGRRGPGSAPGRRRC